MPDELTAGFAELEAFSVAQDRAAAIQTEFDSARVDLRTAWQALTRAEGKLAEAREMLARVPPGQTQYLPETNDPTQEGLNMTARYMAQRQEEMHRRLTARVSEAEEALEEAQAVRLAADARYKAAGEALADLRRIEETRQEEERSRLQRILGYRPRWLP